jgi:hypothetical protein
MLCNTEYSMEQDHYPQITQEEARSSLAEIDRTTQRIRLAIASGTAAPLLVLWGAVWFVCYSGEQFVPRFSQAIWAVLIVVGTIASLLSGFRQTPVKTPSSSPLMGRLGLAWLILFAFGFLWATFLGPWEMPHGTYGALLERKLAAFICTVCMFAYVIMGLWLGRFLLYLGALVTVTTLVGYFFVPTYFYAWMAVTGGGSLIFTGLFIRKFWR